MLEIVCRPLKKVLFLNLSVSVSDEFSTFVLYDNDGFSPLERSYVCDFLLISGNFR